MNVLCPFILIEVMFVSQSRKYYFLSEEADETEDLSQRCRNLEHQVGGPNEFILFSKHYHMKL